MDNSCAITGRITVWDVLKGQANCLLHPKLQVLKIKFTSRYPYFTQIGEFLNTNSQKLNHYFVQDYWDWQPHLLPSALYPLSHPLPPLSWATRVQACFTICHNKSGWVSSQSTGWALWE